jgi:hypothetical protein
MPYITCTKKKPHKVHISVCEKCKGVQCPDYLDFIQPTLFPSLVRDKSLRKPVRIKKVKPVPLPDGPEQLILNL